MMEDDDEEETGKASGSTSIESEISAIYFSNPHLREQPKTLGSLSPAVTEPTTESTTKSVTEPTTSLVDRPISPYIALYRDSVEQAIHGGDREAIATIYSFLTIAITLPLPGQP